MLYSVFVSFVDAISALNVFRFITFRTAIAALTAFFMALVLGPRLIRYLQNRQIGEVIRDDGPQSHMSKQGTPTMGGLLILACVVAAVLMWNDLANGYVLICVFVVIAFGLLGFWDDYKKVALKDKGGVRPAVKFLAQSLIGLAVGWALYAGMGGADFQPVVMVPFFKNVHPDIGVWFIPYAALVIVATSNAVNLTDGLDGLAVGPLLIAAGVYLVFSYVSGHALISKYLLVFHVRGAGELAVVCGAMFGAGLGFLWFNAYPAQVFMGDVGALSLGGLLATVALSIKQELLLFLVGGLFVIETASVILQVLSFKLRGKRVFRMAPLHHHFEEAGLAEPKVTVRFWIVAIVLALMSLATLKLR